jgi:hypothetical protein
MNELFRRARAIRREVTDPVQAFAHRLRVGVIFAALILILSAFG